MLDQWVTPQLGFERALAQIYAALFPRSAAPSLEETPLLRDLVVACAMKDPALVVGGWASEVLRPRAAFSAQQRAVMMQALGALGQAKPEVMEPHHFSLGPLVVACLEDEKCFRPAGAPANHEATLALKAALACFPHVRPHSHAQAAAAAAVVAG